MGSTYMHLTLSKSNHLNTRLHNVDHAEVLDLGRLEREEAPEPSQLPRSSSDVRMSAPALWKSLSPCRDASCRT